MIECNTVLDKKALYYYVKYYCRTDKFMRKQIIIMGGSGILLLLYCSYQIFNLLSQDQSISDPYVRFFIFGFLCGIISLVYVFGGMTFQKYYQLLRQYYPNGSSEISILKYKFSYDNIFLENRGNSLIIKWETINTFSADKNYYFFSVKGQYYIISKEGFHNCSVAEFNSFLKEVLPINVLTHAVV